MTGLLPDLFVVEDVLPLTAQSVQAGLNVVAGADWPEAGDGEPPKLAGFIHSTFSPLVAAVADRCLARRQESALLHAGDRVTALVLVSPLGDVASAAYVAEAVDAGTRIGPLFFFQSVPNAVLGHIAARWGLTGPVVCVCGTESGFAIAQGLLADGDADEVLLIEHDHTETAEAAAAVLVDGGTS